MHKTTNNRISHIHTIRATYTELFSVIQYFLLNSGGILIKTLSNQYYVEVCLRQYQFLLDTFKQVKQIPRKFWSSKKYTTFCISGFIQRHKNVAFSDVSEGIFDTTYMNVKTILKLKRSREKWISILHFK